MIQPIPLVKYPNYTSGRNDIQVAYNMSSYCIRRRQERRVNKQSTKSFWWTCWDSKETPQHINLTFLMIEQISFFLWIKAWFFVLFVEGWPLQDVEQCFGGHSQFVCVLKRGPPTLFGFQLFFRTQIWWQTQSLTHSLNPYVTVGKYIEHKTKTN